MMKTLLSIIMCALMLIAALASCAPAKSDSKSSSADETAKYTAYLEERLEDAPGKKPSSLVIETAENSEAYGVDMTAFSDDGYLTRAECGEVVILGKTGAGLDRAVRDYVKNGNPDDYFTVYGEGYRVKRLTVAGNDISEYAVIRDDGADECNTFASSELVKYIGKACGAVLPEYTASEYAAASDKPSRTITLTVDYPALGDEAFRIEIGADGNITIAGGRYRGCMYGVYDMLRDIGWRFVPTLNNSSASKDGIDYLYESDHVDLTSALNRTETPDIAVRGIGAGAIGGNYNNLGMKLFNNYAGGSKGNAYIGFSTRSCHGLYYNRDIIFPDGFDTTAVQPCFTSEYNLDCIDAYAMDYVQSRLDAGQTVGKELVAVDVAQFDTDPNGFCMCKDCLKVQSEEGSASGAVVRMANRVAGLMEENYPGMYVSILAYCGTDILPKKTVPADNVLVAYCFYCGNGYFTCSNHCLSGEDCDPQSGISNKIPAARFEEWANAIDPANFQIWYYPLNAYGVAFHSPYLTTIREDMEYLASFGVEHVYLCSKTSNGLNNDELGRYIFTQVTWDTSLTDGDVDALIAEWFNIVYGDAGEYLYEYTQMCERAGDMAGCWCSFRSDSSDKVNNRYMADNFDMMYEMFRSAIAAADTEYQQELVERYMGGMLYICIGITYEDRYTNGTDEQRAVIAERYAEMHRIFRKYNLAVYDDLLERTYAPEVLDLETNPFDSWCTKWGN